MMRTPTYHASERHPWMVMVVVAVLLCTLALMLTYLMGGLLQWRTDVRAQAAAAAAERITWDMHDPSIAGRTIQVGALR